MFSFLFKCISLFGLQGIVVYAKLKLGIAESLRLPGVKSPILLRPKTADTYTFREIFVKQEYNINFPSGFNPRVIIDAGANIGLTSVFFANKFPDATIICLEPDQSNYRMLLKNITLYPSIHALQKALWYKQDSIQLADNGFGIRGFMIKEDAKGTTLSTTIADISKDFDISTFDIIKMDIEGSEKEILENGADYWLPNTRCLIIELHDRMKPGCSKALFKAISNYNFSCTIKGENLVFMNNQLS